MAAIQKTTIPNNMLPFVAIKIVLLLKNIPEPITIPTIIIITEKRLIFFSCDFSIFKNITPS